MRVHTKLRGDMRMEISIEALTTCDNCARLFEGSIRKYFCEHCEMEFFICPVCESKGAHCRYCGIPLKRSSKRYKKLVLK